MIIQKIRWTKYAYFTGLSLIAGMGNMAIVYTINKIISDYFGGKGVAFPLYLILFASALVVYIVSRWLVSLGIIRFTQRLLYKTRLEVLKMILRSSFANIVRNKNRVYTALTRDTDNVVNASINLVDILTNTVIILICLVYMGTLSVKLLLCMLGVMIFTLLVYFLSGKRAERLFRKAMEFNDRFVKYLNEILSGYKEISIAPAKGAEIAKKHIDRSIERASAYYQKAHITFLTNRIMGQIAFYSFVGVEMLFLRDLFRIDKAVLVNFIFLVLYVWGPIETVVLLIPALSQARTSLKRINDLEEGLAEEDPADQRAVGTRSFDRLDLSDIAFEYPREEENDGETPFSIGPLEFGVSSGETVFISGGNGSGKTTFINILLGLIQPGSGNVFLDRQQVPDTHSAEYKSLFAPVFSDFHLFDEFYGMGEINVEKANEYLRLFEMDRKITVNEIQFSDIRVSTGQCKRLALINAMLERRPILVLDEFAADQDPHFKRKFYQEILPFLKKEGFTLIAITHDDNYYQYADQLYKMDSGQLHRIAARHVAMAGLDQQLLP